MTNCEICDAVIAEVVTNSTIAGVAEFVGGHQVCSKCFDEERGEQ